MYPTSPLLRGFFRKSGNMKQMLEGHFWSLTRYRIGPRFLGLDYAGNVVFYPSYRKQGFGGWTAVTLGAPGSTSSGFLVSDASTVNVLEDGYPMHYKASRKLQAFVSEEKRLWTAQLEKEEAARAETKRSADKTAKAAKDTGAPAADPSKEPSVEITEEMSNYDTEQKFRDMLIIKCSHPRFFSRYLRLRRLSTFLYKCLYFFLWAVLVALIIQGYLMFRDWLNPPARAGLKNIEDHILHVPRLIFASCVYGLIRMIRAVQPVLDPSNEFLSKNFPQVNWEIVSTDSLVTKAQKLADGTHPSAEQDQEDARRQQQQSEMERRAWWTRVLMVLLAIFSVLCVL